MKQNRKLLLTIREQMDTLTTDQNKDEWQILNSNFPRKHVETRTVTNTDIADVTSHSAEFKIHLN